VCKGEQERPVRRRDVLVAEFTVLENLGKLLQIGEHAGGGTLLARLDQ